MVEEVLVNCYHSPLSFVFINMDLGIEKFKAVTYFEKDSTQLSPEYTELVNRLTKDVYLGIATFVPEKGISLKNKKLDVNITESGFVEFVYKPGEPQSYEEYNEMCEDFEELKEQISNNFSNIFDAPDLLEKALFVMDTEV